MLFDLVSDLELFCTSHIFFAVRKIPKARQNKSIIKSVQNSNEEEQKLPGDFQ